jgi:iron complex transport system permease protein
MSAPTGTVLPGVATVRRPAARRLAWLLLCLVALALLCFLSVAVGVRETSFDDILAGLSGRADDLSQAAVVARLPRTVLAVLIGAALALSGATMQAVTRNPLADPGILGVTGGAALAVVVGITFFGLSHPYAYLVWAIVGAAAAAAFVYLVGSIGGGASPLKLALAGAATSAATLSLVGAVLLPRVNVAEEFRQWQIGGVGGATWDRVTVIGVPLLIAAFCCFLLARGMNSLALGDDVATGLGEHVTRTRLLSAVVAVVLAGAATAVAGPIAFVGLVIPHLCRLLVGTDHRWLLPFSAVAGAALLVAADVIGRIVTRPTEIPVGIVTALVGAPFFIWIVRRQRVRAL